MIEKLTTEQMRENLPAAFKMARERIEEQDKIRNKEYLRTTVEVLIVIAAFLVGTYFYGG